MNVLNNITKSDEVLLSNCLRSIYSSAVLYETFEDDSELLNSIITLVEIDIEYEKSLVKDPALSYRISNYHELASSFIKYYHLLIDKAGKLAYSINDKYGYSIDIASIIGPYLLYELGITDDTFSFYLSLGMTISNIICDILAKHEEKNIERMKNEETKMICRLLKQLLVKVNENNQQCGENDPQIQKSIDEIQKITDDDSEID